MSEMTAAERTEERASHRREMEWGDVPDGMMPAVIYYCDGCGTDWPCTTIRLLDAIDHAERQSEDVVAAAWELYNLILDNGGLSGLAERHNWPMGVPVAKLGEALAAHRREPTEECADDGGHAWVTPVVQVPPDSNYARFAYVVQGQFVRPADVFCRWCGVSAPMGEGEV